VGREYALAFIFFMTGMLAGQVASGGWCDSRGALGPLLSGIAAFVAGLVACATAPGYVIFLAGRVVSGVGAGMVVVGLYVLVGAVYPESVRPKIFGWLSAAWLLPALIGPALAGWLTTTYSWRVVFWLTVPPALVTAAVLLRPVRGLPRPQPDRSLRARRRALTGVGLAVGASAVQWALQASAVMPVRMLAGVAGMVAVALLLPGLVPPGTLTARRGLPAVICFRGALGGAYFGAEAFIPLAMESQRGLSLAAAGLALSTASVGWAFGAWVQGRQSRLARHQMLMLGAAFTVVGICLLPLTMVESVNPYLVTALWAFAAIGMGLGMSTTGVAVLAMSPPEQQGRNSAALQVSDALGGSFGVALAGAVFAAAHHGPGQDAMVFVAIWSGQALLAVAALVLGVRAATPGR
jgi:MFS family permease